MLRGEGVDSSENGMETGCCGVSGEVGVLE